MLQTNMFTNACSALAFMTWRVATAAGLVARHSNRSPMLSSTRSFRLHGKALNRKFATAAQELLRDNIVTVARSCGDVRGRKR